MTKLYLNSQLAEEFRRQALIMQQHRPAMEFVRQQALLMEQLKPAFEVIRQQALQIQLMKPQLEIFNQQAAIIKQIQPQFTLALQHYQEIERQISIQAIAMQHSYYQIAKQTQPQIKFLIQQHENMEKSFDFSEEYSKTITTTQSLVSSVRKEVNEISQEIDEEKLDDPEKATINEINVQIENIEKVIIEMKNEKEKDTESKEDNISKIEFNDRLIYLILGLLQLLVATLTYFKK